MMVHAGAAATSLLPVLADAAAGSPADFQPWSLLSSAGVAGVFAWLLATGRLRSKPEVDDLRKGRDEALARELALYNKVIDDVVPALNRSTLAVERSTQRRTRDG